MRWKIWVGAAVLLGGSTLMKAQTSGTVKDDLFAGTEKFAANASSVTEVDMDPDSLGKVNGGNQSRARRTVLSVVHTYTYDKPGMYNVADVDAFRNKLNTGDWHCSIHVRELKSGESTDVCRKHRTDDLEEQAIITVEPRELTFIHTIRRPATSGTPGKPGPSESFLMPFEFGIPEVPMMDGMPSAAWSAEMRANAAEMRAEAMINRAQMAGIMPGLSLHLSGDRELRLYRDDGLDAEQLRNPTRDLGRMPSIDMKRFSPLVPGMPLTTPGPPAVPKTPKAPQAMPGSQAVPVPQAAPVPPAAPLVSPA